MSGNKFYFINIFSQDFSQDYDVLLYVINKDETETLLICI